MIAAQHASNWSLIRNIKYEHENETLRQQIRIADGSMSASGSAGPGFNPRRGSKF